MAISWGCTHIVESGGRGCPCKDLQRDLAQARADSAKMRDVLERLLGWDHFRNAADGPYWQKTIRAALEPKI